MLDISRTDRMFDSFLDLESRSLTVADTDGPIRRIRRNRRAKRLAADQAYEMFLTERENGTLGDAMSFFAWMIANKDKILSIVTTIISLFGL